MEWTPFRITLALAMLVTGSINTLSTKWADLQESVGKDGESGSYVHPFLQAVGMFLGELTCLFAYFIVVYRRRNRAYSDISDGGADTAVELPFNPLIMLPASLCDMCGTTIMYIGLNLTYASSFQMLRGAVMIFTAILSVLFLKRRIKCYMWVGMLFVIIGLILVGVADIVLGDVSQSHMNNNGTNMSTVAPDTDQSKDIKNIITGDALIIVAQVIVATQMVYEEKFVSRYNVPALKAVGLEGLFGFTILGLLLIPLYYIKVPVGTYQWLTTDYEGRIENTPNAFVQMGNNHIIIYATVGNIISIAFFNFCGISVTKEMSATTRMVLDSCRTLIIWMLGYAFLWQRFHVGEFFVQLAGFAFLIIGMMIYNNLVVMPLLRQYVFRTTDSDDGIVNRSEDEDEADERTPILRNASSYDDSRPTPIL